jgi:hypothetical protein
MSLRQFYYISSFEQFLQLPNVAGYDPGWAEGPITMTEIETRWDEVVVSQLTLSCAFRCFYITLWHFSLSSLFVVIQQTQAPLASIC